MAKKDEMALVGAQPLLTMLAAGNIRELNDVVDISAEIASLLVKKELTSGISRELRQWAELMYTCVQAQQVTADSGVNFITNLVQIAGATKEATQVLDTTATETPKEIEEKPEVINLPQDTSDIDIFEFMEAEV
ncbi:hypothetical protein CMI37_32385 [Candidatus Pacearchaeota archaeon]|nr:hypothetical protein [Candidatus Pacearchaeota archaeon]